jgi:hypothetical protein
MMKSSLDEFVSVVDRLLSRLDELENRVSALEHPAPSQAAAKAQPPATFAAQQHPLANLSRSSGVMPVIGKVFLGIAGAYLLRALAETGLAPQWTAAAVALLYAGMWLLWAARASLEATFASTAYATTAAVILSPMLWELTSRFKVMPAGITATVLVMFVAAAAALAWKRRLASVVWAPSMFAVMTGGGLLVATRDPLPFAVALLVIALLTEAAASSDRWPGLRPWMAIAADLALLALIAIYTGAGVSPDYKPMAPATLLVVFAALFTIYIAAVLTRTVALRREIGVFEIGQTVAVFLLAATGIFRVMHHAVAIGLGVFCLLAAAFFYLLVFLRFENAGQRRNYHVFSTWAAALLLAGIFLCFTANTGAVWLGLVAVAATFTGMRSARSILVFHGALYLAAATLISGLLEYSGKLFIGDLPQQTSWEVWMAGAFTLIGYALAVRPVHGRPPLVSAPGWREQVLPSAFAALASCTVAAAIVTGGLLVFHPGSGARLAALRTLVLCLVALALGWSGSRFRRTELIWLAYTAIAFCTLKLLFEDLRHGSAGTLAFSLFCYGMVWVLVPRFARASKAG